MKKAPGAPWYVGCVEAFSAQGQSHVATLTRPGYTSTLFADDGYAYVSEAGKWQLPVGDRPSKLPLGGVCERPQGCWSGTACTRKGHCLFAGEMPEDVAPANPVPQSISAQRKASPVFSGVLNYFPDALMVVARVSKAGNDKHNPGQPLHWSRDKSNDHMDCAGRHMLTPYEVDADSREIHLANAVWRLLAELQIFEEKRLGIKR